MALEDFKEVLVTCASVCQIFQFMSGILVCEKFIKKGTSNDISPFPFVCGVTSCILWATYANIINETALIIVNVFGALLMFSYIVAYYMFATRKGSLLKQILMVTILITIAQVYIHSIDEFEKAKSHLGIICCSVTLTFFAAPLANLAHVIRVQSSESLPFPLILMSLVVTAQWTLYGYILKDKFITYPNLLGFLLSCFQLSLFAIFPFR
uniref:Sugar transporter SWEET1 n=3 Tax=Rhodnius TaxID=13248 RepID=T1HM70_RHOPR